MRKDNGFDRNRLAEILHYGVVLQPAGTPLAIPFDRTTLERARQRLETPAQSDRAWLAQGAEIWRDACRRVAERSTKPLLLPLSSGLDSRAVLAGLNDCGADVRTVTYGIPGSFDYELAPAVARCAGVSNARIDLRSIEITREGLLAVAAEPGRVSSILDMFLNRLIHQHHGTDYQYVTGYMGDELAGKNMPAHTSATWDEARQAFATSHNGSRTVKLTADDMDPAAVLPGQPLVDTGLLAPDHQLYLAIHQECLDRPISCPHNLGVMSPFLDSDWAAFMLGVPDALRRDRAFFIRVFQQAFPELFTLPGTASGGLPLGTGAEAISRFKRRLRRRRRLRRTLSKVFPSVSVPPADRNWQYLDFRNLLRSDHALTGLFADSMRRVDASGVAGWLDASALMAAHQRGEADHSKALNVLLNLDLTMEARPELLR